MSLLRFPSRSIAFVKHQSKNSSQVLPHLHSHLPPISPPLSTPVPTPHIGRPTPSSTTRPKLHHPQSQEPRPLVTRKKLRPWHQVVRLKDELRTGELSLAQFAADLHEVTLGKGKRPVYEDPERFFGLTYATHALRDLVRDVAGRLAGTSDKAVRQLELTYGGGKTHTLITLYHLFRDPGSLPDLPAVHEFREHVGHDLPGAYPATLCFDKIDVESGLEGVRGPDGGVRNLLHPWSVLAYQLDGDDGLRAIHPDGQPQERDTPPAEPLLAKLIAKPQERELSTLILVDEVLMYARAKAGVDKVWGDRIRDFFQYLTQAVVKVDRAAMVVSLLATEPLKQNDDLGKALMSDLFDVVRRQKEEGVEPVQKKDVAEVLRRRFFEAEDLRDSDAYRSHVIGVVRDLAKVQETTDRSRSEDEEHFLRNFPFHPKLTDVFYTCWTQLEGFQRTRGILRTLATALREAEKWDTCPLVGPAALLSAPGESELSEAVRDLAGVATTETGEGRKVEWTPLLTKELEKARDIQHENAALDAGREAEQAVIAVFLHSQPVGHKIQTQPLRRMIGGSAPDVIELDKGLARWREVSWFLDDEDAGAHEPGTEELPTDWRLGNRPNLRQMHDDACKNRVGAGAVDDFLKRAVRKNKSLTEGASAVGVKVHMMPASPRDVADDLTFRYVLLGADAASRSGQPSPLARSFLETKGKDRPRVHRNALVVVAPSREGLEAVRGEIRAYLGWEEVASQLAGHEVDAIRTQRLRRRLAEARRRIPETVRAAYNIVTTYGHGGEVHAFKMVASANPLFVEIMNDDRARIQETAVNAEALLPDGPYNLWRDDEESRFVADLATAFARHPRLPKALNPQLLLDTVLQGVEAGLFVARLARPDGSVRTWWREPVPNDVRGEAQLEVVLPGDAVLDRLACDLLAPGALPDLWPEADGAVQVPGDDAGDAAAAAASAPTLAPAPVPTLAFARLAEYFGGDYQARVPAGDYDEYLPIPGVPEAALKQAVCEAVEQGTVWLLNGPASVWREPVPQGALDSSAELRPPPEALVAQELTAERLPGAWKDGKTNGVALTQAVSLARGVAVPWPFVAQAIMDSVKSRWLSLALNSAPLSCGWDQAGTVVLERPTGAGTEDSTPAGDPGDLFRPGAPVPGTVVLNGPQVQDLADKVAELMNASPTAELRFHIRVEATGDLADGERAALNDLLGEVEEGMEVG